MERPWHSEGATITFGAIAAACVVAIVVLVVLDIRRREASLAEGIGGLAAIVVVGALVLGLPRLEGFIESGLAHYAPGVRETVLARVATLVFLFEFVLFTSIAIWGALGMLASFAIVLAIADRESLLYAAPLPRAYRVLVSRSVELSRFMRVRLWIRHEVFSLALLVAGGFGLLLACELPEWPFAVWFAGVVTLAWITDPRGFDKTVLHELGKSSLRPDEAGLGGASAE